MEGICRKLLEGTLIILVTQLLFLPRISMCDTADVCPSEDAVSLLPKPEKGEQADVEQFLRLLPVAFGLADEVSYKLPQDTLLTWLKLIELVPKDINVNFNKPLTKGQVSVMLVKTLLPHKGSLVERLLISVFKSQKACFRVALREKLIPPGDVEDIVKSKELAAIMLAVTILTISNPLPGAKVHCIKLFGKAIVEKIIRIEEVKEILDLEDVSSIKVVLAL